MEQIMSKRKPKRDDFARSDSGLWLPKYGLRGPDRKRPDSRRFFRFSPGCCCKVCPCAGTPLNEYHILLNGILNQNCEDCDTLNDPGGYVVPVSGPQSLTACVWLDWFHHPLCGCGWRIGIIYSVGSVGVQVWNGTSFQVCNFTLVQDDLPCNYEGYLPYAGNDTIPECDFSAATCYVTPV